MATLTPAPVAIGQLSFDRDRKGFTADISSTAGLGRVYDDAVDQGLTVVGRERSVVFVVIDEHRDNEGDTTHWSLRSLDGEFTMLLWND